MSGGSSSDILNKRINGLSSPNNNIEIVSTEIDWDCTDPIDTNALNINMDTINNNNDIIIDDYNYNDSEQQSLIPKLINKNKSNDNIVLTPKIISYNNNTNNDKSILYSICIWFTLILSVLNHYDKYFSLKIHKLSLGLFDYVFVFGAFVFGSKFMPVTIIMSIFVLDLAGFLYLFLTCIITVSITQFGKKVTRRHRPDPKTLGVKILDFRTRLTNFSFPSGDTAQSACYGTALYLITGNPWTWLLIPNCAWSRIYFGCHFIGDCIFGALTGIIVSYALYHFIPQNRFKLTQNIIEDWIYGM